MLLKTSTFTIFVETVPSHPARLPINNVYCCHLGCDKMKTSIEKTGSTTDADDNFVGQCYKYRHTVQQTTTCELFWGTVFFPVALGVFLGELVVNGGNTKEWTEMIEGKDKGR